MPRPLSSEREAEFLELSAFLRLYCTDVNGIAPDDPVHPSNVLDGFVVRYGKLRAFEGLKQAIGDKVEETQHLSQEKVSMLDQHCREHSVITLSQLRARYWSKYRAILKRGYIRNETEYYMIIGVLNDLASTATDSSRSMLQALVDAYEQQQV